MLFVEILTDSINTCSALLRDRNMGLGGKGTGDRARPPPRAATHLRPDPRGLCGPTLLSHRACWPGLLTGGRDSRTRVFK